MQHLTVFLFKIKFLDDFSACISGQGVNIGILNEYWQVKTKKKHLTGSFLDS